ncbi:MAG: branched-chain amino acid ABC transporter permease, partial [Ardenticatenia bacterium]|nr:branched-chain amino acid ABC transporter permease [Ardenticatenia bacterium]
MSGFTPSSAPGNPIRRYDIWLWVIMILVAALYPFTEPTTARLLIAIQMFLLITLASNWNLIGGMTGYVDFGHLTFFGIGAYTVGILMTRSSDVIFAPQLSFWQAWPFSGLTAMLFALAVGSATLRLKGPYFSIAMLATLLAMREIVRLVAPITGGGGGLDLPPELNRTQEYYIALGLMALSVGLMWWIRNSEFGLSLMAIREDEVGAEMRGINTTLHKTTAFALSAFLTGLVGGFWAWQNTYIDPDVVFFEPRNLEMIMAAVLGGLGTVWGPPLGAAVLYWLREFFWNRFLFAHLLGLGLMLIFVVLFLLARRSR